MDMTLPVAEFAPLFEPFTSGNLSLANRIVMAPMTRCFSPNGVPGENVAAYYRRRVEGGVGLIVTEGTWINHPGASNDENAPRFYGEDALAGWRHVVNEVHAAGGKIMPQLWHVGLTRKAVVENLYEPVVEDMSMRVGPSGYVLPGEKIAEPMREAEIERLIAAYAEGAAAAKAAGFDGVEVHGAHGYMVDQFFWHETNKREDGWGGALQQRARFGAEMIRACRRAVGPDFPIVLRFSQWKLQDYTARLANTPQVLADLLEPLAEAGVDIFHASQRRFWLPEFEGSSLNLAGWTKKITGKPSITVGSVGLEHELLETFASNAPTGTAHFDGLARRLADQEFDLVAIGRALIADPAWPHKVRQGNLGSINAYDPKSLATLV